MKFSSANGSFKLLCSGVASSRPREMKDRKMCERIRVDVFDAVRFVYDDIVNLLNADFSNSMVRTSKSCGTSWLVIISARSSFGPVRTMTLTSGVRCLNSCAQI